MRSVVEGAHVGGVANPLVMNRLIRRWALSTTTLRVAVPLPVPGRIEVGKGQSAIRLPGLRVGVAPVAGAVH
jgi:hypothetical protein